MHCPRRPAARQTEVSHPERTGMYEKGRKMEKLSDRKQINRTILLFACVYMVSYMTRINLGAVLTAIVADTGMTKTMLSAAITGRVRGKRWVSSRVSPAARSP